MCFYALVDPNLGGLVCQLKQTNKQTNLLTHLPTYIKEERRHFQIYGSLCLPPIHTDPVQIYAYPLNLYRFIL